MKIILTIFFLFVLCMDNQYNAQQTVQYSQYTFNSYGLNPAVAGTYKKMEILMGRRNQWINFPFAPITNFFSVTRAFNKIGYHNYWHGAGIYIEQDKAGLYNDKQFQGTYAFHLVVARQYKLAFGVSLGWRVYSYGSSMSNASDPALTLYPPKVIIPNISYGMRFYSKKFFSDVSVKQIYTKTKFNGKELGSNNVLRPHIYLTLGKNIFSSDYYYMFEPTVHIKYGLSGLPSVTAGCMLFINKRLGLGLYGRAMESVYGVVRYKVFKNFTIGVAYDLILSSFRNFASGSSEFMVGMSPGLSKEDIFPDRSTSSCPVFQY